MRPVEGARHRAAEDRLLLVRTASGAAYRCGSCGKVEMIFGPLVLTLDGPRLRELGGALADCVPGPLGSPQRVLLRLGCGVALTLGPDDLTELACLVRVARAFVDL